MVKELKGTAYRPKIAVLGAKWQYCVHPEVGSMPRSEVDVKCEELLDSDKGCNFKNNAVPGLTNHVQTRPALHVRAPQTWLH